MNCPRCGTEKIDGKPYCPPLRQKVWGKNTEDDPKSTDEYRVSVILAVFLLIFPVLAFLMGSIPVPLQKSQTERWLRFFLVHHER